METTEIRGRIRQFLLDHGSKTPQISLADDDPLLGTRAVDSLGIFRLLTFVESEFGFTIADEELLPEHFHTIGNLAEFVARKLNNHEVGKRA